MKSHFPLLAPIFATLAFLPISPIQAQGISQDTSSALCANGECRPAIAITKYGGRKAFALTDGRTEAIIVPEIGRVMRFGKVGGPNLLWNAPSPPNPKDAWKNYGGDKNWLAPQSSWQQFHGKAGWPPDPALDGLPQRAEVLSGGKLRLTTPLSQSGIRLTRTYYFADNGEFVIEQTARKERGAPIRASIWSITQVAPGDAIFLPRAMESDYPNGFHIMGKPTPAQKIENIAPKLLRVTTKNSGGGAKIGVDAPVSSLALVRGGVAFVQKTAKPAGIYPEGAGGAGFPIEIYSNGDATNDYSELEILGPLKNFAAGGKSTHTMRWSLHDLPSKNVDSPAVLSAIEKLLYAN